MSEYKRGTRVVVTENLPGVPEGTPGRCGRGIGFALKRYRVRFDNDVEAISVAHDKLVPENEWPQFLAQKAHEEIEAAQERARIAEARAEAAESRGLPAPDDEPTAAPAPASPAEPSGPERAEVPEFVPGPEVDPDYAPKANRVSELISEARKES